MTQSELLPPDTLTQQLITRRIELVNLLNLKLKAQKNLPEGHLRIEQKKGRRPAQFYHFTNPADTHGTYIPAANHELARRLAQKDYDHKLIKLLQQQISIMERLIKITENKITSLYTKSCPARQKLINPVTLTDVQYVNNWQNITWQAKAFNEFPLTLKDGNIYHPDFLCLNVRTRQEYIWEHFGLMDNPDYADCTVKKLKVFNENKIFLGKNLIITMESSATPLNSRQVENLINEYLK